MPPRQECNLQSQRHQLMQATRVRHLKLGNAEPQILKACTVDVCVCVCLESDQHLEPLTPRLSVAQQATFLGLIICRLVPHAIFAPGSLMMLSSYMSAKSCATCAPCSQDIRSVDVLRHPNPKGPCSHIVYTLAF